MQAKSNFKEIEEEIVKAHTEVVAALNVLADKQRVLKAATEKMNTEKLNLINFLNSVPKLAASYKEIVGNVGGIQNDLKAITRKGRELLSMHDGIVEGVAIDYVEMINGFDRSIDNLKIGL